MGCVHPQFSCSVMSDSLQPHESQHTRPPCPSPTPGVHSDSCPSSQWCHPAISSSVIPFSSCPQSDRISHSVVSHSLRPHELQHTRPPCPSPTPGVHSDSCPSSQWCHLAISSSVVPFFSCSQHQSLFQWVNSYLRGLYLETLQHAKHSTLHAFHSFYQLSPCNNFMRLVPFVLLYR